MTYFPDNDWNTIPPEQAGITASAVSNLLNRIERENMNLHGLILLYNGYIVLEKYWSSVYKEQAEHVYSITKSVVSLLTGIAVSEKLIDEAAAVISYFPEAISKKTDKDTERLKVKHLLTMSSGQEKDSNWNHKNSIKKFFRTRIVYEPGSRFAYMNGCATMVSAILQKVSGKSLADYAQKKLFDPLEIESPKWRVNPDGICFGGYGLSLKTRDIAKIGLLLLNQGQWKGVQVVPREYIQKATSALRSSFSEGDQNWTAGYGYFFWQNAHSLGGYHCVGLNGHYCIVLPEYNLVCATTAKGDMFKILHSIEEEIIAHITDGQR